MYTTCEDLLHKHRVTHEGQVEGSMKSVSIMANEHLKMSTHRVDINLKGLNTQHSGHMVTIFQTELMSEIYSKSPVRAIG